MVVRFRAFFLPKSLFQEETILQNCLAVGLGGFWGSVLRYLLSLVPLDRTGSFPVNTFLTNVLGAWRAAHETLGVLSLPAALLYLACVLAFPDGETVTLCAVALWLGIPALRSYRVFRGK